MEPPFFSPVPPRLFQGQLQQPDLTLDLPLLQACRPHFLPPSLLVPSNTFLFPRPRIRHDTLLDVSSEYVFDCSYLPQHPHLLVCTCAPKGFTVVLDLETGQAVQHFFPLTPSSSSARLDGTPSCRGLSRSASSSYPSITCARMHGDPSCPLLFSGNSAGDISAYDLRFAGSAVGMYRHPTLLLENAHDGIVSAIRAGGGDTWTGHVRNSLSLPEHVFFSSGLQDNWIRSFDLRFPFHYSTGGSGVGCGEGDGGSTTSGKCVQKTSRGRVPYPIDAVQLNPGCTYTGGKGKNAFCTSAFSSRKLWREERERKEEEEEERRRRRMSAFQAGSSRDKRQRRARRIITSPLFPGPRRKSDAETACACCSVSGAACGVASIDLSPDGTVLAVAQLRAVREEGGHQETAEGDLVRSNPSRTGGKWTSSSCPALEKAESEDRATCALDREPSRRGHNGMKRPDGKESESVALRWEDEGDEEEHPAARRSSPREAGACALGMEKTSNADTRGPEHEDAPGLPASGPPFGREPPPLSRSSKRTECRGNARTSPASAGCSASFVSVSDRLAPGTTGGVSSSEFFRRERSRWRVEGEVSILSIPDGLKTLKSFAVADACAFATVEFSRNGKYLLLSQGVANTGFCVDCRRCFCCCSCEAGLPFFSQGDKKRAEDAQTDGELERRHEGEDEDEESEKEQSAEAEDATSNVSEDGTGEDDTRSLEPGDPQRYFCLWDEDTEEDAEEELLRALGAWQGVVAEKEGSPDFLQHHGAGEERRHLYSSGGRVPQQALTGRRTDATQRPFHRAQLVNLLQSNRIAVLKTPGDGAIAFSDAFLVEHSLKRKDPRSAPSWCPAEERSFRSPLRPEAVFDSSSVQVCRFSSPCLSSFSLSSLPLRLRMFSPHSSVLEERRQAFWWEPSSVFFPSARRTLPQKEGRRASSSQSEAPGSSGLRDDDKEDNFSNTQVRLRTGVDTVKACEGQQREDSHSPEALFSKTPRPAFSGVSGECQNDEVLGTTKDADRRSDFQGDRRDQDDDTLTANNDKPTTPFPKCHPQISQFLCACGPLHPQWCRLDCMDTPFLCSLWGGLVVGLGGSRFYPGLKLWHATTGTVLSWTEGPLVSHVTRAQYTDCLSACGMRGQTLWPPRWCTSWRLHEASPDFLLLDPS